MSAIGTILNNRYEIIAELGKGGMSTVFLARDTKLESYWAVKQVKNNTSVDIDAFKKEVELLAGLAHADIPRIVDRIEINDDYFVVMDFIDGVSLGKKVSTEGPQTEKDVVEWAKMLCGVLEYMHTAKDNPIVYRDMKPENVMLTQAGRVKLIDFGIAKECVHGQRQIGAAIGTKGYAAPEQYNGASNILDERTDIYSLGATLFYLTTGMNPEIPPKEIPPVRQINPLLSEGLEYIIRKCTRIEPADRYQSVDQLKQDFENIDKLNTKYRSKMVKDLWMFLSCFILSIGFGFMSLLGYNSYQAEVEDNFQMAYNMALDEERAGNFSDAANHYKEAIVYRPTEYDTYLRLFDALLPRDEQSDDIVMIKSAIDEMRKNYIENELSAMYHDTRVMNVVARKCLEVNDPVYAAFAVEYLGIVKSSSEYQNGILNNAEVDSYEILALNMARNITTLDFREFHDALVNLETISADLPINGRLQNMYTIMLMYSTYPSNLPNAYKKIFEIGSQAKEVLDSNIASEDVSFNSVIPMYEMVASALYSSAAIQTDTDERRSELLKSVEWFAYLEDLNVELGEPLLLKKGNAHKAYFDTYFNVASTRGDIDETESEYLQKAMAVYREALNLNPDSFLAQVYLTQAMLDEQMLKPADERNFARIIQNFNTVETIKNKNKNLPSSSLAQFSSLKQHMQTAGLEVS